MHQGAETLDFMRVFKLPRFLGKSFFFPQGWNNDTDSKSGSPQGLVGSNPTASATKALKTLCFQGFFLFAHGTLFYSVLLKCCPMMP